MKCDHTIEKSGIFCEFEKGHGGPCGFVPKNARYDNGWYYCWLIERRDLPQPAWWAVNCTWTTDANKALWFARESDAQADAGECPHDVVVCEHGFDLRLRSAPSPLDEGMRLLRYVHAQSAHDGTITNALRNDIGVYLSPQEPAAEGMREALENIKRVGHARDNVQRANDKLDYCIEQATAALDSQLAGKGDL